MFTSTTLGANFKMMMGALLPSGLLFSTKDQAKIYPLLGRLGMFARETGYLHIQATKPDTVGTAVNQNPLSLAVYLLEKFSTWTHLDNPHLPDGGLLQPDFPISLDSLLDNICIYWFTGTITTSMRYYAENFGSLLTRNVENIPCRVPAGLAAFPQELATQPKSLAAHKFYDIVTYSDMPRGGHFAAMEEPHLLAQDILSFITIVENRNQKH
ncbi:hypothetical protein Pcinc_021903 [Petrolisthes cinctipes]|uniref:Epoxide hydrolase n=1 Tax=Petrolisthes cinctipes TaxID=88211 RepID=A0AAE1KGS9_PETCI|nr:hypothetical protein Pcinc_021903 [Petrolisthes cinctipes]